MTRNRFGYFLREGIASIFSHGLMSFASIFVIVACLLIMGCFVLLSVNVDAIIDELEGQNQIVAFIDERYSESDAIAIRSRILNVPNVKSVEFVSNSEAMESFQKQYEDTTLLDELDASILRHRYIIYLKDITKMDETTQDLEAIDGIAKVNAHQEIASGFQSVRNIITIVSVALVAVLFIISLFIMSNTIRLTTVARREEIAVMKMVGATNSFIRKPFLIEGIILGLMGALIAYIAQWGLYTLISGKISEISTIGFIEMIPFTDVSVPIFLAFLAVSVVVGAGGSIAAIRNYLKV